MLVLLVEALFAITALLVATAAIAYGACVTVVAADVWGERHRERTFARGGIRAIERDHRRRAGG